MNTLSKRFVVQYHKLIINQHQFEHSKKSLKISKHLYTNIFYHVSQRYIDINWTCDGIQFSVDNPYLVPESDYFFSSTKIRIFYSATLGIRIFFLEKKHNPLQVEWSFPKYYNNPFHPLQVKWSIPYILVNFVLVPNVY
jgi:hypothetical protein